MIDNLPPLPEPALVIGTKLLPYEERHFSTQDLAVRLGYREGIRSYYTTAQVEEIRRAAILAERERCATVCEAEAVLGLDDERGYYGKLMAAAIREGRS